MSASQFRTRFIAGALLFGVVAFSMGWFTGFGARWRGVRDGMTQSEVRQALGTPTWIGSSGCVGAGGKDVIRWEYRRPELGRWVHYYVDFDYIGNGGAPVVFRTERFREDWGQPSWWPWPRARARA